MSCTNDHGGKLILILVAISIEGVKYLCLEEGIKSYKKKLDMKFFVTCFGYFFLLIISILGSAGSFSTTFHNNKVMQIGTNKEYLAKNRSLRLQEDALSVLISNMQNLSKQNYKTKSIELYETKILPAQKELDATYNQLQNFKKNGDKQTPINQIIKFISLLTNKND